MSSSMRNFVEAYAAVHNNEAKEELTSSRDCISEMNLSDLTDADLDEIVEQVLEEMFSQGYSVDSAHLVFSEAFEESSIVGRQQKIERLCEALNRAFGVIDSKASTVALEEFAKYRDNKKLQESWSARFNQEKRVQRAHDRLIAAESLNVKTQLLKIVEKADKSYLETDMNKRKKNNEKAVEDMKKMGSMKNPAFEEVSQIRKSWGDAYRSIYADKETISEKGMNPGFKAYLEKQKAKKGGGDEGKSSKGGGKPDFLDLDKDGDKKEPMKKASKEMKKEEVEDYTDFLIGEGYDCSELTWDDMYEEYASLDEGLRSAVKRLLGKKDAPAEKKPESRGEQLRKKYNVGPERSDTSAKMQILQKTRAKKEADQRQYGDSKYSKSVAKKSADTHDRYLRAGYSKYGADDPRRGKGNKAAKRAAALRKEEKMGEGVQFSEAELKAFEEIVNSWED